ncbi:outer membrane protein assembly factor BamD [Brumimicrobium aurantiacum]|uniref:Outer membrane protein assembly factor BamD n=1 Tax=Brumimicrobium aurantiacum TaxID=1737063 RepID=A0A3E1EZB5_9FLAO|nr:outer membrane protein assembly factor BamD [Brumimicrobium aurantiacum]RFC54895.1 outer membrane protein assembly factor BamD [Brumimicrobium aurantiacum]
MKMILRFLTVILFLGVFSACSEYQKIVKGDNYEEKFAHANRMYDKGSYTKALTLYEQIYQRYPKTDKGEVAYYRIGKSYFALEDYYMAGYYFNQFTQRYPVSENAEEALFMTAICSVKNSPKPSLDQEETDLALNDLQLFVQRYPDSDLIDSCNRTMDRLRFKLETKKFESVELYDRMENNRAAVAASKSFLEDYPRSEYIEEAAYIQFRNSYVLAMNSVLSKKKERVENAMETYAKYSYLFEDESYAKRTKRYNEELSDELISVAEQYSFREIGEAYELSRTTSEKKKVYYLEETLKRFDNFAKKYPESELLDKAKAIHKRAEKELVNS